MKVLILAGAGRTAQDMAGYCKTAFDSIGHNSEIVNSDFNRGTWTLPRVVRPLLRWLNRIRFQTRLGRLRPELVLVIKGEELPAVYVERLKDKTGVPWINWWIDDPGLLFLSRRLSPAYDLFFTNDPASVEAHRQAGAHKADWLSFAHDPETHRPFHLTPTEQDHYGADIVFAGRLTPQRAERLALLVPLGLAIWSDSRMGWITSDQTIRSEELPSDHPLRQAWRGNFVWGEELAKLYSAAKICVNVHSHGKYDANMRVYEATACGSLLLTDDRPLIRQMFVVGGDQAEVVVYSSPEDMVEKARYYLSHDDERKAIAARGLARCQRDHSYALRMKRILELIP